MDIIEASHTHWEEELVWDCLHVPKPQRGPHNQEAWAKFQEGRAIYKDPVVIVKAGWPSRSYSVAKRDPSG